MMWFLINADLTLKEIYAMVEELNNTFREGISKGDYKQWVADTELIYEDNVIILQVSEYEDSAEEVLREPLKRMIAEGKIATYYDNPDYYWILNS